ncbi:hypothetical protein ALC53_12596 [Atta colombica]|uniref:Uncharacterized protein n=1 Tax=Atta colombica TaxID=520822 RepID=A0A151HZG2_9HYME|nr:hypothetical protein ALC53_12596 [Atta colombica]
MELILLCARCSWHSSDNIMEETSISCFDICQKCGEKGIEEMSLRMESSDEREFVSLLITFAIIDNNTTTLFLISDTSQCKMMEYLSNNMYKSPKIQIAVETTRMPANRYCFGTFSPHGDTTH